MKGIASLAAIAFGSLVTTAAAAEWSGKGELGGVLARGNTETETINASLDIANERERWKHKAGGSLLRTVNDGVTAANRWELRAESEYRLTERGFVFGSARYEDDQFTDYEYQATIAAGYGHRFIDTEVTRLDGRIGVGYRQAELSLTGATEDDAILSGAINFERKLTGTTLVTNRLLVESGSANTFVQNQLGIEVKINSTLALGLGYAVRHNTDVLPGTEKTDQVLTANLVFGF
jgi:putative salt-induced outer membrane protein